MFESLTGRLGDVFTKLRGRGALSEKDVDEAMREVRRALLEADVALPVVKDFIDKVKARAVGVEVLKSITPGQQVIKIVHDELVEMLGGAVDTSISLHAAAPVAIMMVGLQGSGKTTSTAKIAKRFESRDKRRVLMASLDTRRPAAQEQLKILGEQTGVATLPIIAGQQPVQIARRAIEAARLGGYDIVMLDTAGRIHIDEALMQEVAEVRDVAQPHETLLVADSLTGQDAVNVAQQFKDRIGVTGIVLTRTDGDGRGGAALSMRAVTGVPIKLLGTGEKLDALEDFKADRVAGRILGMGDVVSLVEKAAETIDAEKAQKIAAKMKKGQFDLDDLAEQLAQMKRMGGMKGVLGMLPGVAKAQAQMANAHMDDGVLKRQTAIISSMTKAERRNPALLNASRKRRVAAGSGTEVQEINRLLKLHRQMADMMKMMARQKGGGLLGKLFGGGMPEMPPELANNPDALKDMLPPGGMPGGMPGGFPGLGAGGRPKLPGLPGLPGRGGFPGGGLPGLPGGKKKK
ncbi:signal recognition particle protein [Parvibaculum sedimenti]|uniref:Signal recognition particle protein n=2 Tax=Parvibaculum sedimenti TaxID=2608632 RepID=A0A6N6VL35_9HYPH|nr:signal recognition particle protein [Parvibaculum sedimenti]KAB7742230.1 signal recognition particle protein [Parvibaculum sedimenti]